MNAFVPEPAAADVQTPSLVPELLREYGQATQEVMFDYLSREPASPYLDALMAQYPRRPGKMMRSGICIATACAFGARPESAVRCAAAIELFHNALLIHDDVEDESEERRGRPTLHAAHGVPLAVNAGDALMLLALRPFVDALQDLSPGVSRIMVARTQHMARQTAEGQALELGWRADKRTDITEDDYLTMALKKTAWMATIWPSQMGALIGAQGAFDPDNVVRFGFFLGLAFQIQDDLLNLEADPRYGKEWCGDLYEGKRTLMLVHTRRTCSDADRQIVDEFLTSGRQARTPAMVDEVLNLMRRQGSLEYAHTVSEGLAGAALREHERAYGGLQPSRQRDFLKGLVPWVFERT